MKQELENKIPVAQQVEEIEQVDEAINAEYSLGSDGVIQQVKAGTIENPEDTGA